MAAGLRFVTAGLRGLTVWQVGLVLLHAIVLGAWRYKADLAEALPEGSLGSATDMLAGALGGLGLLSLLVYQTLPQPKDEGARPQFDRWSVVLHLLYTWSLASCLALWAYQDYAQSHDNAHEEALKVWFLAMGFFGGFLNLTRSTGTRSTTSTIYATTSRMAQQVQLLRRGQQMNGILYAEAVNAQLASSKAALGEALVRMVDAARAHPTIPPDRLSVSLWVRGQTAWRILAGSGIAEATRVEFTQPVQQAPTAESGIVAALAASEDRWLIDGNIEAHPWYKVNPHTPAESSGMAVVLIEDFVGQPIAALCLTARPGALIPSRGDDPDAYAELLRLLMAWKIAFTLPMVRLFNMEAPPG